MNKNVAEIIDALAAHQDSASIDVLEEIGTNSPDNEVREYTSRALVRKNVHDSLKIVIINQGKNYHLNDGCIPFASKYSCLAFSRSSSDSAVLYLV